MGYVIQEYDEKYGWCLFTVCRGNKEFAEQTLAELQKKHPDKQLRVAEVDAKDCWWNDPFLAN